MDLKIKDVVELLKVSETTIRRWLADGKIPAYRLNHQYRFSRSEIEDWMIRCRLKPGEGSPFAEEQIYPPVEEEHPIAKGGVQQFNLYRAIHRGDVFYDIPGTTKEEIILATTRAIAPKLGVDAEVLSELLMDRESLMPTGLNQGIAVPHTRDFFVKGPFDLVVVVFPKEPIEYGSLDGLPVHTLFFLFACSDKSHLRLLAKLAHLCSQETALQVLDQRPDKKNLLEFVRNWESHL